MNLKKMLYSEFPLSHIVEAFNEYKESLTDFRNRFSIDYMMIVTDFAGDRSQDIQNLYGFLILPVSEAVIFKDRVEVLIDSLKGLTIENAFEYKKLKKCSIRRRSLDDFLNLVNEIDGFLLTFVVDKELQKSNIGEYLKEHFELELNQNLSNKAAIVLTCITYLFEVFGNGRKMTWYTDRDDIFGGNLELQKEQALSVIKSIANVLKPNIEANRFQFVMDRGFKDDKIHLLAIPDLVCGSFAELVLNKNKPKEYASMVLNWHENKSCKLKKIGVLANKKGDKISYHLI